MGQAKTLYFTNVALENLQNKAKDLGASTSRVIAYLVQTDVEAEDFKAWCAEHPETPRGRPAADITKAERACLSAIKAMMVDEAPAWRFMHFEIATAAGLAPHAARLALSQLKLKGLVDGGDIIAADDLTGEVAEMYGVDRWGRARKSGWWLPEEAVKRGQR